MDNIYTVNALAGSSGNFILVLLRCFLSNNTIPYEFPDGHAHYLTRETDLGLFQLFHTRPDWEKIRNTNSKSILITVSANMYERLQFNFYLKNIVSGGTTEDIRNYWESFPNFADNLLKYDMSNIPYHELVSTLSRSSEVMEKPEYPFNDSDIIPLDVRNNICVLKLHDIIHNKEIILNSLSEFIQRPITECIHQTYDNYLIAQQKLLPSMDDSEYFVKR
jgi:hypothetical protein